MNILEAEDVVKGLPDQVLFQYAQNPPPQIPQYLAVSEVQRRQEMRQRFQAQQGEQQTVKDQILQGGIASAGGPPPGAEQPPMAPPGSAPPMDGGQPPVMAAAGGMMPYSMAGGKSVPQGQSNPSVFRQFMQRNFATPQGLAANIGLVGGALLGGPIGAGIGGNLGTYIGQKLTPPPAPLTPMELMRGGLRAPAGGAVGGGSGGGLPYGGPTSYAGRDALRDLIDQVNMQQGKPTVTVEEIPQGMAVGGLVIPELGSAFESSQQSGYSQASAPPPGMSRDAAIRRARSLMEQGREMDALVLLRQAGVNPSEVGMYSGGLTPGGIVYMEDGRKVPNFLSTINSKLEEYSNANRARTGNIPLAMRIIPRSQDPNAVIAQAKDLVRQGRTQEAVGLLSQEGIDPSVLQAAPPAPPAPPAAQIPSPGPSRRGAVEPPSITPVGIAAAVPPPAAPASAAPPVPAAPPVTPPVTPPAAPAGFADPTTQAYESLLSRLPQTYEAVNRLMPQAGGINAAELERFKPTQADYINPDAARQREELLASLRAQGEARRKEDMAAAERAMKESEAPIQQASEEARRAAIASTLMRLGAGVAAGKGAEGLASASESVEQIMGRAREQAAAERRASRQEFRAAEREATRAERSVADAAFQMQASNITANESAQRDFVRDQKSFAQWAYGQMRDAGREARQAQGDAIKLSIGITQSIDQAVREALRTRAVSENQYTETFGTVFKDVLKEIKETDWGTDDEGDPIVPTAEQLLEAAGKQTDAVLSKRGIVSPASVITVTSPQDLEAVKSGQRYRGPDGIVRIKP